MPSKLIVHKVADFGGGVTSPMTQAVAQTYLGNLPSITGSRATNLSQALNQAFNGQGKPNGTKRFVDNGFPHPTFHASAGVQGVSSVSLFYYVQNDAIHLFAMGAHAGASSYNLSDFKPSTGDFAQKTVAL